MKNGMVMRASVSMESGNWIMPSARKQPGSLERIAKKVHPSSTWADIVLPKAQLQKLRKLAAQLKQRLQDSTDWRFSEANADGPRILAIFDGTSDRGKLVVAQVLARDLNLQLFRIDLSAVVSKYIGDTEKNLGRIFDAAADSRAALFFDEADVLLGKRTEVRDSSDRYANAEINYFLQRVETYDGLVILANKRKLAWPSAVLKCASLTLKF